MTDEALASTRADAPADPPADPQMEHAGGDAPVPAVSIRRPDPQMEHAGGGDSVPAVSIRGSDPEMEHAGGGDSVPAFSIRRSGQEAGALDTDDADPFIAPVSMEDDPDELFPGDRGTLDAEVRRVLVHVLQRRFLSSEGNRAEWKLLLEHQQIIESRMHDLYLRLVVDLNRGLAYKQQVRSDELEVPVLLKDQPYTRIETLVLVHLRTVFLRESAAGDATPRLDVEDIEQTVLSYLTDADGSPARQQKAVRAALDRLDREGVIDEETSGRYRIRPLIEVVLSAAKLAELREWLRTQLRSPQHPGSHTAAEASDPDFEKEIIL